MMPSGSQVMRLGILVSVFAIGTFFSFPVLPAQPEGQFPIVRVRTGDSGFVVYDWSQEHCEEWDVPDAPLRAFRNAHGDVVAFASDINNRRFIGSALLNIRHTCHSVLTSHENADPSVYSGFAYVTAVWTDDGEKVNALIHNEYHAEHFPNACIFKDSMKCWFTTILAASSTDGGQTFSETSPPTVVASAPFPQDFQQGRHRGFFNPSNIIFHQGFYYMLVNTTGGIGQKPGLCLFRTATVSDATSWRAYDGVDYKSVAIDPYRADTNDYVPCQPVAGPGTVGSISWNAASGLFLIVYQWVDKIRPDGVTAYSWSKDLINWSAAQTLFAEPNMSSHNCSDKFRYGYPSVLDPQAVGRNFDTVGEHPMLFLTRFHVGTNCDLPPNRDLTRFQLDITRR
jgi:hypothetical protein